MPLRNIKKLLVANRSEIAIRVFRSATELGIRTVAIYSHEDRYALHRFKADEAYQLGNPGEPIKSYLNIKAIIDLAKRVGVDAIHPGYGFLSERAAFAKACEEAGIKFIGPSVQALESLGDKTAARAIAIKVKVPILGGTDGAVEDLDEARTKAQAVGLPVMIKASMGGGGRGMRVVKTVDEFDHAFESARREALTAFGCADVFIEKFIARAKHIEVQLLGDEHGNLLHLFERDCSVQRRHQKVVELAPAPNLSPALRKEMLDASIKIGKEAHYSCAGTVEFLVDIDAQKCYFIEVNPRIQVEHTVTEEVTNIDIVKSQILVAMGHKLSDPEIGLASPDDVKVSGFAIQCRVTTENPENKFMPDYGRVTHYRSAGGMGVRLDAGTAFSGAVVNPFYDSLLTKVTTRGRNFKDAINRMERVLREFRIRGVKTNIPFLLKVMSHQQFIEGECTTRFIDETPELFEFEVRRNRATRMLTYLAETIVNGNPLLKDRAKAERRISAPRPEVPASAPPEGYRQLLQKLGPDKFAQHIRDEKKLLITDTTFRDAHQSLFATRMRTHDLLNITEAYAHYGAGLFSLEMWGGATFDTSMRFLKECPWARLSQMREKVPNILFQMLLRASNAVGYKNYPDNVVQAFVKEAAATGIDVFRIFDALNVVSNMRVAMDAVIDSGAICEAAICYSGDLTNPGRTKYDLKYYISMAKELERAGTHILAIKDMAGLCKPKAAAILIKALREEVGIPIHFHTHDTAGIQAAAILEGCDVGLDIVDAAMAPMSGGTSQPNLNTLVEMLRFGDRDTGLDIRRLDEIAEYWRAAREFYRPFESVVLPANADLYHHEMPGGQYTNLFEQARSMGLADQWRRICDVYAGVNQLFGDIVKVTPTSKAVGDMALFMVANDLTNEDVLNPERKVAFPASVIDLIGGGMGTPPGGFPPDVVERVLQGKKPFVGRPGETLPAVDFDAARKKVMGMVGGREPAHYEVISWVLYEKVFEDFAKHRINYADTSMLPTPTFFYGLESGEEIAVDIEPGKTLIIKYLTTSNAHADGTRTVFFELNGQPREITVRDTAVEATGEVKVKADPAIPGQVGSTMPGMVVNVVVKPGDIVKKGQRMLTLEAMKMETMLNAQINGKVSRVHVQAGSQVETGDLLVTIEPMSPEDDPPPNK